jgi:hypothetical protein
MKKSDYKKVVEEAGFALHEEWLEARASYVRKLAAPSRCINPLKRNIIDRAGRIYNRPGHALSILP